MDGRAEKFTGLPRQELVHRKHCFGAKVHRGQAAKEPQPGLVSRKHPPAEGGPRLVGTHKWELDGECPCV